MCRQEVWSRIETSLFRSMFSSKREEDLREILGSANPFVVLQRFSSGSLFPPFMTALTRECEVWRDNGAWANMVHYDPWGPDGGWPRAARGDRLCVVLSSTITVNAEILGDVDGVLTLDGDSAEDLGGLTEWKRYRGTIVRRFCPADYYIAMLGIYLRLIFFVDPSDGREHTPGIAFELDRYGEFRNWVLGRERWRKSVQEKPLIGWRRSKDVDRSTGLFVYLAALYLRLVTRHVVYRDDGSRFSKRITNGGEVVLSVVEELFEELARVFECDDKWLEAGNEERVVDELAKRGFAWREFPDVDRLARSVVGEWRGM